MISNINKKCANRSQRNKTQTPIVAKHNLNRNRNTPQYYLKEFAFLTNFKSSIAEKEYNIY